MLVNTVTPHASKAAKPVIRALTRCLDRGCSRRLAGEQPDSVKTKQVIQEDVELLYTGDELASHYLYAQVFTSLWVTMMYSGGAPILYPIAFLNFLVVYWVYKTLLIRFYQKTNAFNQDLPKHTIRFFQFSVVLHVVTSLLMYSNHYVLSGGSFIKS